MNRHIEGVRVRGVLDAVLYEVVVTGDPLAPVIGSRRVRGLFRQFEGETVLLTHVGPAYVVRGWDPESVLALLVAETRVTWIGDTASGTTA